MENTLQGLQGLPGLSEADNAALQQRFRELDSSAYAQYANQEMDEYIKNNYLYTATHPLPAYRPISISDLPKDFGESRYDKNLNTIEEIANYKEERAYQQGAGIQILNGIAKGITTAATTFVSGTLGTVYGIFNGAHYAISSEHERENISAAGESGYGYTNNAVNLRMQDFNNFMEQFAPNYRSFEEQNTPWYRRAFKGSMAANFWANDIVTNMGFTIGSMAAGLVWMKAIQGIGKGISALGNKDILLKAKKSIGMVSDDVANSFNNPKAASSLIEGLQSGENLTSPLTFMEKAAKKAKALTGEKIATGTSLLLGSVGEAQLEALQSATEFRETHLGKAKKYFTDTRGQRLTEFIKNNPQYIVNGQLSNLGRQEFDKLEAITFDTYKEKVEDEAIRVGNNIFAYETALLTLTNSLAYAKLFSAGYKTQSAIASKTVKFDKNLGKYVANKFKDGVASGWDIAKSTAMEGLEESGQGFITAASKRFSDNILGSTLYHEDINDQYANDRIANLVNAFGAGRDQVFSEEGGLEFFSGILLGAVGVPTIGRRKSGKIGLKTMGGIYNEVKDVKEKARLRDDAINHLNEYLAKPETKDLFKGVVLQQKYSEAMKQNLEEGNPALFKDNEHKAIMSTAMAFQSVNKMDDFYKMVDTYAAPTDEQIKVIREESTIDPETQKSVYDSMTDEQVKEVISKQAKDIKTKVSAFIDLNNSLTTLYAKDFSKDTITGLAFNLSLAENKRERSAQLAEEVKEAINAVVPEELRITNSQDFKQVRKAVEAFGQIEDVKEAVKLFKQTNKEYAASDEKVNTVSTTVKEKTGMTIAEANLFVTNLKKRAADLMEEDAKKYMGVDQKIEDLYSNLITSSYIMVKFTQAISNPKKYLQDITQYHVDSVKEAREQFIQNLGEIKDEAEYTNAISKLKLEDREEFLQAHITTNSNAKPFAEKILINDKLVKTVQNVLEASDDTVDEEARNIVKKIFEDNKDALYTSIKDGLVAVEKDADAVNSPSVTKLIAEIKSKLANIEEINNFYKAKTATQGSSNLTQSSLSAEELTELKKQSTKAALDLLLKRAQLTDNEALYKNNMSKGINISAVMSVSYIDPTNAEKVSVSEVSDNGKTITLDLSPKFRIVINYALNKSQIYVLTPSVAKALAYDNKKFLEYINNTPATYEINGWGFTEEQIIAGLRAGGVKHSKLEGAYEMWKSPFYAGEVDSKGNIKGENKDKGWFKNDWSNVPIAGDEMLQAEYEKIIKQIETGVKPVDNTTTQSPEKPVDDFITIGEIPNKNVVTGYKQAKDTSGNNTFTILSRDKKGKDTGALYSYIPMSVSAISPNELSRLSEDMLKAPSLKLHKVTERKNQSGGIDYVGDILVGKDKLEAVKLTSNYILEAKERKEKEKANKLIDSKYSGSRNLTVTEYSFRDEDREKKVKTPIKNTRDQFIYEVFVARGTYDFINSGKLHELWEKDNNLEIRFMKLNSAPDSSLITLPEEDGVYFMYIEHDGKRQIVGNVQKGSELEIALEKDNNITRTIREFSAGDKAIDEKVHRDAKELMNSNTPPIIALITSTNNDSTPVLDIQEGRSVRMNQIMGMQGELWKNYKGKPLILVPTATGMFIPMEAITRGFGDLEYVMPKSENTLMVNESFPIAKQVNEALKTISKVTYIQGQDYNNTSYLAAKEAVNQLNKLVKFKDPNGNNYSLDLYYSSESDTYFVAVHLDGKNIKRRLTTEEFEKFNKYKSDITKPEVLEAVQEDDLDQHTILSITEFINKQRALFDKRATVTLDTGNEEYNYRQLLALVAAVNPMFIYSPKAFNSENQGLTVKDWLDNKMLLTTLSLPRSYNGRFFLNDSTPASKVNPKEHYAKNEDKYFGIGAKAGNTLGFNVKYDYADYTLIIEEVKASLGKDADRIKGVFNTPQPKIIDLKDSEQLNTFLKMLQEFLQTNVAISGFAQKSPLSEEYFFRVNIEGKNYHYIIYKDYNDKGELIYKEKNTVLVEEEDFKDLYQERLDRAEFEEQSLNNNPNIVVKPATPEERQETSEPKNEIKQIEAVFNYTDKFRPDSPMYVASDGSTKTLQEFIELLNSYPNPTATVNSYTKLSANPSILKKMNVSKTEFMELLSALKEYTKALTPVNNINNKEKPLDPNDPSIKEGCKK